MSNENLSYFQLELLKSQLESSLESTGSSSKESVRLILQYSSMLAQFSKVQTQQQNYDQSEQLIRRAFQILLPNDPHKALTSSLQYWRLLTNVAIEFYLVLLKTQKTQQGLNAMLTVYNLLRKRVGRSEFESDLLCFHIAMAWDREGNHQQAKYMAQETILMIEAFLQEQKTLKVKSKDLDKKLRMFIQMNDLLVKYLEDDPNKQLKLYEQCYNQTCDLLGRNHELTMKYQRRINAIKAQQAFEETLAKVDVRDLMHIRNRGTEIEFDIADEKQDVQILKQLERPKSAASSQGRIRKLKPAAVQSQGNVKQFINQSFVAQPQNVYYMFSNQRTKTSESQETHHHRMLTSTTTASNPNHIYKLKQRRLETGSQLTNSSMRKAMTHTRIVTQESLSFLESLQEEERKIRKVQLNNLILKRPETVSEKQQLPSRTRSPPLTKSPQQDQSSRKRQRIKDFDMKRKNIIQRKPQRPPSIQIEPPKISKSASQVTLDRARDITVESLDAREKVEVAATRIQRFYRQRKHTIRLLQECKESKEAADTMKLDDSKKDKSNVSQSGSDSDSLNNIIERDEAEEQSPLKRHIFKRSTTMLQEDERYRQHEFNYHQSSQQNLPLIQINNERFRRLQQVGRNSVKLIIQSKNEKNQLQIPTMKRHSHILSSQRKSIREESDESFLVNHQPLYMGSQTQIDVPQIQSKYFTFLSFFLHYQNRGNSLWRVKGIESSVICSQISSESIENRMHKPQHIQLVVQIETQFFKGPLVWKIGYDKKLFRMRKDSSIFRFADGILQQYLTENKLNSIFIEVIEERQSKHNFVLQSMICQERDECIDTFMEKLFFLITSYSYQCKQVNSSTMKICQGSEDVAELQRLNARCREIRCRLADLHNKQRTFNTQTGFLMLTSNDQQVVTKGQRKVNRFQKVRNTVLFAMSTKQKARAHPVQEPEKIHIPLLQLQSAATGPDVGAINKHSHIRDPEPPPLSSGRNRDQHSMQIKSIINTKRMSSTLDSTVPLRVLPNRRGSLQKDPPKLLLDRTADSDNHIVIPEFRSPQKERQTIQPKQAVFRIEEEPEKKSTHLFHKVRSINPDIAPLEIRPLVTLESRQSEPIQLSKSYHPGHRSVQSSLPQQKRASINTMTSIEGQKLTDTHHKSSQFTHSSRNLDSHVDEKASAPAIVFKKEIHDEEINKITTPPLLHDLSRQTEDELFYSKRYFEVSPTWRVKRKQIDRNPNEYKFAMQLKPKYKANHCYLNPFPMKSLILCSFLKKDSTLFQVEVQLLFLKEDEQLSTQVTQSKTMKIEIRFTSFDRKIGNKVSTNTKGIGPWQDQVTIYFKDFLKWFVGEFRLYEFIAKQSFTSEQKISILSSIQQNISIQDCKLKVEYFKENTLKKQKRKYERRDLYMEYVMMLEAYHVREYGSATLVDQYLKRHEPTLLPYFQTLQDKRAKLAKTLGRKKNRLIARILKQHAMTSTADFMNGGKLETGPIVFALADDAFQHVLAQGGGLPQIHNEDYSTSLLQGYSTTRILKRKQYAVTIKLADYCYIIWKSVTNYIEEILLVRVVYPFAKHSTDILTLRAAHKDKLINLTQVASQFTNQNKLRSVLMGYNLVRKTSQSGIHTSLSNHYKSYTTFSVLDQRILHGIRNYQTSSTEQLYELSCLLKISLLATHPKDRSIWDVYFHLTRRLMVGSIRNFGPCFLDFHIYVDVFNKKLIQDYPRQTFVRIDVYKKENMRSVVSKIVLSKHDISHLFLKQQVDITWGTIPTQEFISRLYEIVCHWFFFQKQGLYKQPKIYIKSQKTQYISQLTPRDVELTCKFPWLQGHRYNDYPFQPYPATNNFYNQISPNPTIICHIPTFIHLPLPPKLPESGEIKERGGFSRLSFAEESPHPTACIFTISVSRPLKSFFIHLYFSRSQRKFVAQIHFTEIKALRVNERLDTWVRTRCGLMSRKHLFDRLLSGRDDLTDVQLWVALSRTFQVSINEHSKTLLHIPVLEMTCIFSEVLLHQVKRLNWTKDEALFSLRLERKKVGLPGPLSTLSKQLRKIRIVDSTSYNLFIKIQWFQHQQRMQSCKLPFPELLIWFYQTHMPQQGGMYDYAFSHADLLRLSKVVCEMIILNWQSQKMDLQEVLPLVHLAKSKQDIKTNASVSLRMAFVKQQYVLMYTSQLITKPSTLMTLFLRKDKDKICFYIQRLSDSATHKKSVSFAEIENVIPGFRVQTQGQKYELGRKLFLAFKNRMILQAYYETDKRRGKNSWLN